MIVYISIGNSDDKLPQRGWAEYIYDFKNAVESYLDHTHGLWYSEPHSEYQNMCICIELPETRLNDLKRRLTQLRQQYNQDSIAFAIATTEFI